MGEMNPMPGHVEKSVENMGKQLYAEGTSPVTTGTTSTNMLVALES